MITRHRVWTLALAVLLLAGVARTATGQACPLPAWNPAAPLSTGVYGAAVTEAAGAVYAAGGHSSSTGGPVSHFQRYVSSSNAWTALAPLPTPTSVSSLVYDAAGGRLFLFGGTLASGEPTALVQVYSLATGSWSAGPPLPEPRTHMASGVLDGLIYLAGGYSGPSVSSAKAQLWRFSTSLGTYTALASLPGAVGGPGGAVAGSRFHVMGGRDGTGALSSANHAYNPATNTWAVRAPLPTPLNVPAAVSLSGALVCASEVLLIGGGTPYLTESADAPEALTSSYLYEVGTNSWSAGPSLAAARSFAGAAQAGGMVLAVGGWSGAGSLTTVERLKVPGPASCNLRSQGVWTPRAPFPAGVVRSWGAYFPLNGKFYVLGGRTADAAGSDLLNPVELDPGSGIWTTKAAAFADNRVSNMVGGVLSFGGTQSIVLVGGTSAGGTLASSEVRQYDPMSDTLTTLALDPWPGNAGGDVLPGGAAVYGNKLYVFGGFQINTSMTTGIWQFDPSAAPGSRWSPRAASLPIGLGYIPVATSGGFIYLLGGSTWVGALLVDSTTALRYDPLGDTITAVASLPRATAETRAVRQVDGSIWVLGGGRTSPNPAAQVDVYLPGPNTWTTTAALATARRNFAADVDPGTGRIWAVGGYAPSTPGDAHEELRCVPKGDVDRDGYPDLLFRSNANGAQNKVWLMNGVARSAELAISPDAVSADWKIRGVDDFNADGQSDLVFWNQLTGHVEFWLMNGAARSGAQVPLSGGAVLPVNWDLSATADFNHDLRPDIVWRNFTSQKIVIWTMSGTAKLGNIVPTPDQAVNANWKVVAALDYNDDGNTDFLWYNHTSGKIVTWYMDAAVSRTAGQFTTPANAGNANWHVLASADYSRGYVPGTPPLGSPDIVWRNETSGSQVVWHMDFDSVRVHGEFTNPVANTPALEWTIVGPR